MVLTSLPVCLGLAMRAQLPKAIHHIDDPGDKSEEPGRRHDVDERDEHKLQHDPRDRRHLQKGRDLSRPESGALATFPLSRCNTALPIRMTASRLITSTGNQVGKLP